VGLQRKVSRLRPRLLAMVGLGAYRVAFQQPRAVIGLQPKTLREAFVWLLPNTSGLNAHHRPADLARHFREMWMFASSL